MLRSIHRAALRRGMRAFAAVTIGTGLLAGLVAITVVSSPPPVSAGGSAPTIASGYAAYVPDRPRLRINLTFSPW